MEDVTGEAVETIVAEERVKPLTAGDLIRFPLFGLWKDREDMGDSLEFARKLKAEVEQRHHSETGGHT